MASTVKPSLASQWLELPWTRASGLPRDFHGDNSYGSLRSVSFELDRLVTSALSSTLSRHGCQVVDALLVALALAAAERHGAAFTAIDWTGHGRSRLPPGIDISRTIGLISSIHPVLLPTPDGTDPLKQVRSMRQAIQPWVERGNEFAALRYLRPAGATLDLRMVPRPSIKFNHQTAVPPTELLRPIARHCEGPLSGDARRAYELNCESLLGDVFTVSLKYSTNLHEAATIRRLASRMLSHLRLIADNGGH